MSPMLHLLEVGMHKLDTAPAPLLCLPALSLLVVLCPGEPLRVLGAAPVNMDFDQAMGLAQRAVFRDWKRAPLICAHTAF